ncbi:hypothetical protein EDB19DRAFT_1899041 [Suillus lakei]|nr:hypothetical protein EDB19DRAFT_1899041 [Suillus lakei]
MGVLRSAKFDAYEGIWGATVTTLLAPSHGWGGFTPLGLTLMQNLAQRGVHIIAISPKPVQDPDHEVEILINLLRSTTKNDQIFADECDLTSVHSFCSRFLTVKETRPDAIIFAHEYQQLGSVIGETKASLASFLFLTLLLPVLLIAPTERDIRIIDVVNPFYAAVAPSYGGPSPTSTPPPTSPLFHPEGWRSLQMVIFTRHLQRVLDALPSGGQIPKTDDSTIHVVSDKVQKSNIVTVSESVCPGLSRSDTIAPLLDAVWGWDQSTFGIVLYMFLQPFLRLSNARQGTDDPEEVTKAGALYRECAVVNLRVPSLVTADATDVQAVWEGLENVLKEWEKVSPQDDEKAGCDDGPSVDTSSS